MVNDESESAASQHSAAEPPPSSRHDSPGAAQPTPKVKKKKPERVLPSDRVSFETQLSILRASAVASGYGKKEISNSDVEKVSGIGGSSISYCNPFFNDIGLIEKAGIKQSPSTAVCDYARSSEWETDDAGLKLASILKATWFAEALLPKLSFKSLTREEAIATFADESKAPPEYRKQLDMLIEYLVLAGLIRVDGDQLTRVKQSPSNPILDESEVKKDFVQQPAKDVDTFKIPIPGKDDAVITVPKNLDVHDWAMLDAMLKIYISRLKQWGPNDVEAASKEMTDTSFM